MDMLSTLPSYFVGRLSVTGKETEPLTGTQRIAADMVYRFNIRSVIQVGSPQSLCLLSPTQE